MELSIKEAEDGALITVSGDLTVHHVRAFLGLIREKCSRYSQCTLDLSNVSSIDSAGIQSLIHLKQFHGLSGKKFRIIHHSPPVISIFDLYGLAPIFGDKIHIKKEDASQYSFSYGTRKSEMAGVE